MDASVLDVFEFCRLNERREGEIKVADLPRLSQESEGAAGVIAWTMQGAVDKLNRPQLTLFVSGEVELVCQRCLAPFAFQIVSKSVLLLAEDEANADELDAMLEDDEIEVIVGSRTFNIMELIEDEAMLSIPFAPKHEICVKEIGLNASQEVVKPSPFSVLKGLK